jgi:hypothetical protein
VELDSLAILPNLHLLPLGKIPWGNRINLVPAGAARGLGSSSTNMSAERTHRTLVRFIGLLP